MAFKLFLLLFFTTILPAAAKDLTEYQATISEKEAVFTFPIKQDHYEWCPGGLQYTWNVKIENNRTDFELGFYLFTAISASPCEKGNFSALLQAGQFNFFKVTRKESSVVSNAEINHRASEKGKNLEIIISDKKTINLLFSSKPKNAIFQSQILNKKITKKAPISYN